MRGQRIISLLGTIAVFAASAAYANEEAIPQPGARLIVREDHYVIRESWRVAMTGSVTVCHLRDFPTAADASSIVFDGRREGLNLQELTRASQEPSTAVSAVQSERAVRIDLVDTAGKTGVLEAPELQAVVSGPKAGAASFDLTYKATGITWDVHYDVVVRGALSDFDNTLAVDVEGRVHLFNHTERSYSNAVIGLAVGDSGGQKPPLKQPGFLLLEEDSPLSDLWRHTPPDLLIPHRYDFSGRHELPAGRLASITHVSVQRKPVRREIFIRSEQIPTDARSAAGVPRLVIKLKNEADYGRGKAVPPGPASVYLGSQQATIYQQAWFNHTPADGDIEIDMGAYEGLSVRRFTRERIERIDGYEQSYELRLENRNKQKVPVTMDESPPLTESWTFLRSSAPVDKRNRRLAYSLSMPAESQMIVQYAVRVDTKK